MEPNLINFDDDDDDHHHDDDDHHVSSLPHPERPAGADNVFFPSGSSSSDEDPVDEEEEPNWSMEATSRRLDSMIHFLDQRLLTPSSESPDSPLPEFIATAGGVFDPPRRSAVHPSRPPPLELRPRPSRESQVGRSLRALADSPSHLCAAREDGSLLSWTLPDLAPTPSRLPYPPSPVTSLLPDAATAAFWTGHHDGRIRCWKVSARAFKECLSWVAHRGPVLSLIISTYGDLWSGSEGGSLKIWPWEALHKSLSSTPEELHMAALFVERSYVDLKAQVAATAICNALNSDVRYLVSDHSRAKVWSASFLSFALWDSRTRELLKVFNIDGQLERMDFLSGQEFAVEDEEMRTRVVAAPKKEKTPPQLGFFQRSRNALIGAADAVRRVAAKGGLGDDNRKTEALIATPDGMIWSGCTNGLLVQWDGNGHRLQDFQYHSFAVQCFSNFGSRLWVGYASGTLQVLDLEGHILGEWVAHSIPIIKMAVGAQYVFTLANHGGIRGWNVVSPGPLDSILRSQLARRELLYARIENVKVLAGTWNVAQERASPDSLISWLGSAAGDVGLVVVGLQEVEMGAGVLAMSAAKETVGLEGSSLGQWWLDMIGKTLDEGSAFERVGSRQLAGLLVALWVRRDLKDYVGDVDAAAVPCGFGRAIGNKGAVALKIRIYGRIMCFVNCHFAAHLEAVGRRNADFDHVYRTMIFGRASNYFNAAAAGASSVPTFRIPNSFGTNPSEGVPELSQADMVIFLGDFNYRLSGISYDEARDFISQRSFDWLKEKDQLRTEMEAGNVFQGMREAVIRFPPTYKFDKYQPGLSGYDSGEKKRVPAWCDRILYRDSRFAGMSTCSLDCPIVSEISEYDACMDVTDSDHKPVRCVFSVDVARVDESVRRKEFADIVKSDEARGVLQKLCVIPEAIVSTNNIILQNQDTSVLRITNKSDKDEALFEIICEGQAEINEDGQAFDHHPRGSFGFPRWLEVIPATGTIKPGQIAEVSVHLEDFPTLEEFVDGVPRNSWCEDTRDEEAILIVKVRGTYTTTETRDHRIRVRHCCSALTTRDKPKSNGTRLVRGSVLPRSDYQQFSGSYDVVNHLRNLHSP